LLVWPAICSEHHGQNTGPLRKIVLIEIYG
jgi:hypothetical protein